MIQIKLTQPKSKIHVDIRIIKDLVQIKLHKNIDLSILAYESSYTQHIDLDQIA